MTEKQRPCCARLQIVLTREQAEIGRLARMASAQAGRGRDNSKALAQIAEIKTEQQRTKAMIEDHEAEHVEAEERERNLLRVSE